MHLSFNPEPSRDLSYATLAEDEKARHNPRAALGFGNQDRFKVPYPKNGNLRVVVPDIDKAEVRAKLSPAYKVNTSTRTIFNNDQPLNPGESMADKIASPRFRATAAMKAVGHMSMDLLSPTDPRVNRIPAAVPEVGPGTYNVDPLGDHTTGMPRFAPGQSHHMVALEKHPDRPSPAFKSPERNATRQALATEKSVSATVSIYLPPDYTSWTAKGCFAPKMAREIQAERWGKSVREPRPPPASMPAEIFDPQVSAGGKPSTVAAYASDASTPSYKAAFGSGMPRLVALPGGNKPDTRVVARSVQSLSNTPPSLGPGSYNCELPRYKSWHAALQSSPLYHSLASGKEIPPMAHHHVHVYGSLAAGPGRGDGTSPQESPKPSPGSNGPGSVLRSPGHQPGSRPGSSGTAGVTSPKAGSVLSPSGGHKSSLSPGGGSTGPQGGVLSLKRTQSWGMSPRDRPAGAALSTPRSGDQEPMTPAAAVALMAAQQLAEAGLLSPQPYAAPMYTPLELPPWEQQLMPAMGGSGAYDGSEGGLMDGLGGDMMMGDDTTVGEEPDPDWLLHQAVVALSYARTEETRSAKTIASRRAAAEAGTETGGGGPISPVRATHLSVQAPADLAHVMTGVVPPLPVYVPGSPSPKRMSPSPSTAAPGGVGLSVSPTGAGHPGGSTEPGRQGGRPAGSTQQTSPTGGGAVTGGPPGSRFKASAGGSGGGGGIDRTGSGTPASGPTSPGGATTGSGGGAHPQPDPQQVPLPVVTPPPRTVSDATSSLLMQALGRHSPSGGSVGPVHLAADSHMRGVSSADLASVGPELGRATAAPGSTSPLVMASCMSPPPPNTQRAVTDSAYQHHIAHIGSTPLAEPRVPPGGGAGSVGVRPKFDSLSFLRRVVPHKEVVRSHIVVSGDLRVAREAAQREAAAGR